MFCITPSSRQASSRRRAHSAPGVSSTGPGAPTRPPTRRRGWSPRWGSPGEAAALAPGGSPRASEPL
eukprot:7550410-Lingulodinium_polyedra.AAC.1